MPKVLKNETKAISLDLLADGINHLSGIVKEFSTVDARLVALAAKGFAYARRWTSDTTVTNQDHTKRIASALIRAAREEPIHSELTGAIVAYGHALEQYAHCDYNGSNRYVMNAFRLTR